MKYLTVSIIIITCLMLVINTAFADFIPPDLECWGPNPPRYCKYEGYRAPYSWGSFEASPFFFLAFHPKLILKLVFLILLIDFLYLSISTTILSYFFLKYINIKILLGALIGTIIGTIIDLISEIIAIIIHIVVMSTYLLEGYELNIIYYVSVFLISFWLLKLMYSIIFNKLYKVGSNKKVKLVTIILAIITNPAWFALLSPFIGEKFLSMF
jgi:hypothetical protein